MSFSCRAWLYAMLFLSEEGYPDLELSSSGNQWVSCTVLFADDCYFMCILKYAFSMYTEDVLSSINGYMNLFSKCVINTFENVGAQIATIGQPLICK